MTVSSTWCFTNGHVFTGVRSKPWVEAVVVSGDVVVAYGTAAEMRDALPSATEVDLEGRTLLPGFVDAHNHYVATGEMLVSTDVRAPGVTTKAELLRRLSAAVSDAAPGEPVVAFGLDAAKYTDGRPGRADLDRIAPDRRVVAYHVSGHGALVNSVVLAGAGIADDAPDPPGGSFGRDPSGRLDGFCFDGALQHVLPVAVDIGEHGANFHTEVPLPRLVDAVERAGRAFLRAGLTTVCDAQVSRREMVAYRAAREQGRLPVRTVCMPLSHQLEAYGSVGVAGPCGDEWLSIGPMKFYADGSLIGGQALFSTPYGPDGEYTGYLLRSVDELRRDVAEAYRQGWRVGVHVQGDLAITHVLDALDAAQDEQPRQDPRPRLEHAGMPTPAHLQRMAGMNAIAVNQPSYLVDSGDEFLVNLGDRAHELQPMRDELRAGVRVVISSDSDVASFDPLDTVAAAMHRRTLQGRPIGSRHELTLDEALFAHTVDAAYAVGVEHRVGSLESGRLADLVAIDGDLGGVDADGVREQRVWFTMLGGRVAYAGDGAPAPGAD